MTAAERESAGADGRRPDGGAPRAAAALARSPNLVRLIVLLSLVAFFGAFSQGSTVSASNIANVLVQSAIRGIAACGQALVVMTAGLDLSVSGVVALALMLGGSLVTENPRFSLLGFALSPWLAILAMLATATLFGLLNGVVVARFRLPSLIVTLGTWQIGVGLAYQVTGSGFVDKIPLGVAYIGQGDIVGVPIPILILAAVVAATYYLLHHTPFGTEIVAVGGNPRTALVSGVPVIGVRVAVFAIAGCLYGVGAVIGMSRFLSATMAQASGLELATIAAVAIGGVSLSGGKGTIVGVILGTLIIGVLENGLNVLGVGPAWQAIVKGFIVIAAVAVDSWRNARLRD